MMKLPGSKRCRVGDCPTRTRRVCGSELQHRVQPFPVCSQHRVVATTGLIYCEDCWEVIGGNPDRYGPIKLLDHDPYGDD
jgi:hypothetical protein